MKKKVSSLYIHIPFCKKICSYCDFTKLIYKENFSKPYLDELIKDLDKVRENFFNFKTIYIGGGSPSSFNDEELEKLLKKVYKLKKINSEFSIEFNPEDITINKLKLLKKYKINRISIGIQSFNERILKEINRDYGLNYFELINEVKKYIKNINVDLIYGFKNQTIEELKYDLDNFIKLDVDHISIYSLTVNKNTIFYNKNYPEQNNDDSRIFYDYIVNYLKKYGYLRYEVSNFAKNKKFSKHNLNYWNNNEYIGVGIGAHGYFNNVRYNISPSFKEYINGNRIVEKEVTDKNILKEYYFITNLRKYDGFSLKDYKKIFKTDFYNEFKEEVDELVKSNLCKIDNRFYATDEGIPILDFILLKLIKKI